MYRRMLPPADALSKTLPTGCAARKPAAAPCPSQVIVTSFEPSKEAEPVTAPVSVTVRASLSLVAVAALPVALPVPPRATGSTPDETSEAAWVWWDAA